ncbi:MAG: hypothetical protein QOF51_4260 [Chloroflexota bacterium]|nr:hypothetical protein [Chloroflexota bacterium]
MEPVLARPLSTITVFGSSRVHPGDDEYEAAQRLGRLIAESGWALCNGGHDGTMEAAAAGAKAAGGRTIGVSFSRFPPEHPNRWLDEEIIAETLFARLERLVTIGDAYVVLCGGIGTLVEFSLVWSLLQTLEFASKPLVVVGSAWRHVMDTLERELPMYDRERTTPQFVDTVDAAVALLRERAAAVARAK